MRHSATAQAFDDVELDDEPVDVEAADADDDEPESDVDGVEEEDSEDPESLAAVEEDEPPRLSVL